MGMAMWGWAWGWAGCRAGGDRREGSVTAEYSTPAKRGVGDTQWLLAFVILRVVQTLVSAPRCALVFARVAVTTFSPALRQTCARKPHSTKSSTVYILPQLSNGLPLTTPPSPPSSAPWPWTGRAATGSPLRRGTLPTAAPATPPLRRRSPRRRRTRRARPRAPPPPRLGGGSLGCECSVGGRAVCLIQGAWSPARVASEKAWVCLHLAAGAHRRSVAPLARRRVVALDGLQAARILPTNQTVTEEPIPARRPQAAGLLVPAAAHVEKPVERCGDGAAPSAKHRRRRLPRARLVQPLHGAEAAADAVVA